jgi:NADPH:quinone reductase-like Zn-dependent oxidoreductase
MKSFEIQQFGIDQLALVDREKPEPHENEVLVRLTAASLNFRDLLMVEGKYNPRLRFPLIPLSDGVGVVEKTGSRVTRFQAGDRVAGIFMQTWIDGPPSELKGKSALGGAIDGVAREYICLNEEGLVHVPSNLTDVEAAALPCAAVTAWHALFEHGTAVPGDTVLIQGTGGVSTFALRFAVAAGLRTIVTSSSDEKLARVREFGAHEVINYKQTPEWGKQARALTSGLGVDNVIEVGGSNTIQQSLVAARTGGMVSVIGILGGVEPTISPAQVLMNSVRVQGIYVGSRSMFERMNKAIVLHDLKPVISKVFPWTELKDALRHMKEQGHFGKICLEF